MRRPLVLAATVLVALAALGVLALWLTLPGPPQVTVTAEFAEAPGLYAGNYVDVLGIPVGRVVAITPGVAGVSVRMEIPAGTPVPRRAHAELMAPDVVNDRYVQLSPAYTGGPTMVDGSVIPTARTAVPVSVDQIVGTLDQLARALGPHGANQAGALSGFLASLSRTFGPNGANLHSSVLASSQALTALAAHPAALTGLLDDLGTLTRAAAANTGTYQAFAADLAAVSTSLAGDDADLGAALSTLQQALGQVAAFVQTNQSTLTESVGNLRTFAAAVAAEQQQLGQVIDVGPRTLENLNAAVDNGAPGGPALRARYDPTGNSMALVRQVCGSTLLRGLVVATDPAQRTELDVDCLLNAALGSLSLPPGASAGPDLSLQALVGGGG